jgi:hypothetical protein
MKKNFLVTLALLTLIITACGGQPTQTPLESVTPTQTVAVPQPTPVSASAETATGGVVVPTTGAPVAGVSFANDVMPILSNSCSDCHGGKQMKAGLDLSTYESLMTGSFNGSVIVTGNSADSYLVQLVSDGEMPKRGPKLTVGQIQIISDWINAGALNN